MSVTYDPGISNNANLEAFGLRNAGRGAVRSLANPMKRDIYRGNTFVASMDVYECTDFLRMKDGLSPIFGSATP